MKNNLNSKTEKPKYNKIFLTILFNPLLAGSIVMIVGSNAVNFLNYVYHIIMVRLLTPASYGELAALLSLSGLLGIIPSSLSLVIIKFVSSSKNKEDVIDIISWFNSRVFIFSVVTFLLISIFSPLISSFLRINNNLVIILIGLTFLFSLASLIYKSALQGLLKFQQLVFANFSESALKLILGVIFVLLGFSVNGAVGGLVIASFAGFFLSKFLIRNYLKKSSKQPDIKSMFLYSFPVLMQSISLTLLYSSDIILIKHFFSSHDAGIYALISTLGKIIFFGTGPIGAVMFPLISQRQSRGDNYQKVFILSLILTLIISLSILTFYWYIPEFIIKLLNPDYLEAAPLLIWYGIFITLYTICSLFISYYLSIKRTNPVCFALFAAMLQILLIWFFHDTLLKVILISCVVTGLLLAVLLIYSGIIKEKTNADKVNIHNSSGI